MTRETNRWSDDIYHAASSFICFYFYFDSIAGRLILDDEYFSDKKISLLRRNIIKVGVTVACPFSPRQRMEYKPKAVVIFWYR